MFCSDETRAVQFKISRYETVYSFSVIYMLQLETSWIKIEDIDRSIIFIVNSRYGIREIDSTSKFHFQYNHIQWYESRTTIARAFL